MKKATTASNDSAQSLTNISDFSQTLEALRKPIPDRLIKTRPAGKGEKAVDIDYLEWTTVVDILNRYAPTWNSEIKNIIISPEANAIIVTVAITINGVTRENTGLDALNAKGYGDCLARAKARALKRSAALFGIGIGLYTDEDVPAILATADEAHRTLIDQIHNVAAGANIDDEQLLSAIIKEYGAESFSYLTEAQLQEFFEKLQLIALVNETAPKARVSDARVKEVIFQQYGCEKLLDLNCSQLRHTLKRLEQTAQMRSATAQSQSQETAKAV